MRTAVLAVLLLLALAAAGCGGGGGDSTSTAQQAGSASGDSSPPQSRKPYQGGEKSIEEFGQEASGSQRSALLGAFHAYLGALAARDYASACGHLSVNVRRSLEQLLAKAKKGVGCPRVLPALLAPTAATIARQQDEGQITKVRVKGERAFVVFHAPGAKLYQLTMVREGGRWKVATVAASVLVPSAATLGSEARARRDREAASPPPGLRQRRLHPRPRRRPARPQVGWGKAAAEKRRRKPSSTSSIAADRDLPSRTYARPGRRRGNGCRLPPWQTAPSARRSPCLGGPGGKTRRLAQTGASHSGRPLRRSRSPVLPGRW
jgi:hypothetical protein